MADSLPFLTLSSRRPADGNSMSSGDSAYGSTAEDDRTSSATHDISRVNYHIKHLPDFAKTLEDSAARAFPNHGGSQRYKKVHVTLLHWNSDDLFVLPELEDLEACFREDYGFETETFPIPSDNAHLELMLKIGATIKEHESNDTLFIVYYGGHAKIDDARQSTWCANRSSDSPWLQWSAIQTLLERSLSDVLILLDCCAGAASATFPNGNSITETISASSWDAIAPDPGRYSFTNALIEVLQDWKRRSFSAAMLHAEVLARLKHPRPIMLNGKNFEARSTPVHFMMTANHRAPSIEVSRIVSSEMRPPSPPQEPNYEDTSNSGRSTGPQEIIGSEPNEDVPHVMISLALEDDQNLNINDWQRWLQTIPAIAKYVKVQGVFKSHSTLLLLSMPVMVWDLLPEDHACNFVAFVRSNNLAFQSQGEQVPVEDEVEVEPEVDESRFSIFSGTTAYTFDPQFGAGRRSSVRSPMPPSVRSMSTRNQPRPSVYANNPYASDKVAGGQASSPFTAPARQRTAPPAMLGSKPSHDNTSTTPIMNRHRSSRRDLSKDNLADRPELAPHVQSRLEEYFLDNPKPTVAVREFLASNLGVETIDIDLWFLHRWEQQEVANRLQNLKIDDHSHDPPRGAPRMILPGHLNKLLEIVPPSQVLIVDLRSSGDYERSHIHGAVNLRAPASFVSRATPEMVERALADGASRSAFSRWRECKCVVFYDKHVEFAWEAPTAEALFQKFRNKGWAGQCFVLKGHYREFSASFDKYIVGTKMTDNARTYLLSLQEKSWEKTKEDYRRYDEWFKLLEDEDRRHTDLVPSVKAERMEAMVKHQKEVEDEFERREPSLFREALDLKPDGDLEAKAPMAQHLESGLAKMHEAGKATGSGKAGGKHAATPPGIDDYDLLESEEEQLRDSAPPKAAIGTRGRVPTDDVAEEKKQAQARMHGGRGLFNKIMRSGRSG